MKIEVTYKRVFDSEEFYDYSEFTKEKLAEFDEETFIEGLIEYFFDWPDTIIDSLDFKQVNYEN